MSSIKSHFPDAAALSDSLPNPTTTQVGADQLLWDNSVEWVRHASARSAGDGDIAFGYSAVAGRNYNGSTWDRQYNNFSATLLASAARTGAVASPDQATFNARSLRVSIDVSAYTSGTLTVTIQTKDPLSGVYSTLLASAGLVATGHTELRVGVGLPAAANLTANDLLARTIRVSCSAVTATYSISADLLW